MWRPGTSRWKRIVAEINENQNVNTTAETASEEAGRYLFQRSITVSNENLKDIGRIEKRRVLSSEEKENVSPGSSKSDTEDEGILPTEGSKFTAPQSHLSDDCTENVDLQYSMMQMPVSPNNTNTEISPTDVNVIRPAVNRLQARSLSLSDLTEDTIKEFIWVKKINSVPNLNDDSYNYVDRRQLLTFYAISKDDEDENVMIDFNEQSIEPDDLVSHGDMNEGRKRRHVATPSEWKKNKAKRQRLRGEEYLGYRKPRGEKLQHDTVRPARELKETCKSNFCEKSKFRGCDRFTEVIRKKIHSNFWKNMSWDQRKIYINGLVKRSNTAQKTKTSEEESRRQGTLSYFLPITKDCKEIVQVCREMFLNTLALGSFTVQSWVKESSFGMAPDSETQSSSRKTTRRAGEERKMHTVHSFLDNIPKLPSHYARKDTTKLYLEPNFHSLKDLFQAYQNYCDLNEEPKVCRFTFHKIFHEKNLSLYTLKKDMCDVCSCYKAGNLSEVDYQIHTIKKNRARQEKSDDKKKSALGEFILLTLDLEAVKVCPFLTASSLYFKTKLTCHNYTVYNLDSNHCTCYWFDETAADLTSSTFASFLIDYLERHCITPDRKPIVIFSDGCTYQNRNVVLSNALLVFSKKHGITVTQKFLEPGHTQMECDSVHSAIERKLKNREIHLPSDYVSVTKEARIVNPYEVVHAGYDFVKNYADPNTWIYKSIRPGRKAGDPQVVDIRAILYEPNLKLKVKLSFDDDWIDLPQRSKAHNNINEIIYTQLNSSRLPIKATKYNHLQQLKPVLPKDCHNFYDTLPVL